MQSGIRSYEFAAIVTLGIGALAAWYVWRQRAEGAPGARARSTDDADAQRDDREADGRAVDNASVPEAGPDSETHACVCGAPASLRCARCRAVYYCCRVCQRKHYSVHKAGCRTAAPATPDLGSLFDRATAASKQGRYRDTMNACEEILAAAGRAAQPLLPLHALLIKAHAQLSVGSLADAQQTFDEARRRAGELLRAMDEQPEAFARRPHGPGAAFRFWFARKSVAWLSRRAAHVTCLDALSAQAGAHAGLAYVARRRGDLDAAMAQARCALEVSQRAEDGLEEAASTSALAMVTFQRDKREGLELMRRAARLRFQALAHNTDDTAAVLAAVASAVSTMCNLATALNVTGDRQEALTMYMSALLLPTEQLCQRATHMKLLLNFHTICEECGAGRGPRLPLSGDDFAALATFLVSGASAADSDDAPDSGGDPFVQRDAAAGATASGRRGGGLGGRQGVNAGTGYGEGGDGCGDDFVLEGGWVQVVQAAALVMDKEQRADFAAHLRQLQALAEGSGYEGAAWARRRLHALLLEGDGREMDTMCGICLESLPLEQPSSAGQEVVVLECFHALHCACFESWLTRNISTSCPLCQLQVACVE